MRSNEELEKLATRDDEKALVNEIIDLRDMQADDATWTEEQLTDFINAAAKGIEERVMVTTIDTTLFVARLTEMLNRGPRCDGRCGRTNRALPVHTCPYAEEIHNDHSKDCNCCDACANECAMDI